MADVRIAILMCEWGTTVPDASPVRWSRDLVNDVFEARNGWSVGSWWDEVSLGLRRPRFDIFEVGTLAETQESEPMRDRATVLAKVVELARSKGILVDGYEHHVAFMQPNPNPSGAINGGAVLDRDATHAYYAHEIGHVMGFDHPYGFGPGNSVVEYADPYCLMGFERSRQQPPPATLGTQVLDTLGPRLWNYATPPSAATLYAYCPEFRKAGSIRTISPGTNDQVTLAALSEPQLGVPLLLRIPIGPDQQYLVEYRAPTGRDQGVGVPTVVVHSLGLPWRSDNTAEQHGLNHPWFEKAIARPFHDAWTNHTPSIGVEVVGTSPGDKTVMLKVTSPAVVKSAVLTERTQRVQYGTFTPERGGIPLNRESDPMLCHDELETYEVTIERFNESVELDLATIGFVNPVIDEWRVQGQAVPPSQSPTKPILIYPELSWTRIEVAPPRLPHLVKYTLQGAAWWAHMRLAPRADGAKLSAHPGGCAFVCHVEAVVRDAALDPADPASRRVAAIDVAFVTERIVWEEAYQDAVERCWVRRFRGEDRLLRRPPVLPTPEPPPWLDPGDRRLLPRVEERIAERASRLRVRNDR